MTIGNIIGRIKTTGVFPLNQEAVHLPQTNMEQLDKLSGISFIPLYTPSSLKKSLHKADEFSEETNKNQRRHENGFDIPDKRYEAWVRMFHPEALRCDTSSYTCSECSYIEDVFSSYLYGEQQGELLSSVSSLSLHSNSLRQFTCHQVSHCRSLSHPRVSSRHHSQSPSLVQFLKGHSSVNDLLNRPLLSTNNQAPLQKKCARVLTSSECLRQTREK